MTTDATDGRDGATTAGPRLALALAALGVVYGDIGTSPIYAIRECFHGEFAIALTRANVLGVLSLVFWALTIVVSIKYLGLVVRADNHGEGGAIALTALLLRRRAPSRGRLMLVAAGLFAASLLYGDGMITPAISVLSAIEGVETVAPGFAPWVIPVAVAILAALFALQHRGTGRIGMLFGPIVAIWFVTLATLGITGIRHHPDVLFAIDPRHGADFLLQNGWMGFLVLGAVFLVVTGAEALYADIGHFGVAPIRTAWFALAFPALLLNYMGQGALLLERPESVPQPFFALAPDWFRVPLVALTTVTTIIASQAVIAGAFSLTNQAIKLGYCPRMKVVYTSEQHFGQIYIPVVNWVLMVCTIAFVVTFGSSSRLAAAYGVAVTTTMLVTTLLFYAVARERWSWGRLRAAVPALGFAIVDLSFFGANISKVIHGAWIPLAIGGVAYLLLSTWKRGRDRIGEEVAERREDLLEFIDRARRESVPRVPGKAVFMSADPEDVPSPLRVSLARYHVLHEQIAVLTISAEEVPRVPREEKVTVETLGHGLYRVRGRFGFQEEPSVPWVLAHAREKGLDFELEEVTFFVGSEHPIPRRRGVMRFWRGKLFAFLLRNAQNATAYFHLPTDQIVEIGSRVEI
jgi:KUP system potassium uptake protein